MQGSRCCLSLRAARDEMPSCFHTSVILSGNLLLLCCGHDRLADVIESAMGQLLRGGQPHLAARLLPAVTAARRSPASAGRSGDPDILLGAYFKEVSEAQLASGDHWGAYQVCNGCVELLGPKGATYFQAETRANTKRNNVERKS